MHYFEFGKRDTTLYSGGVTASINTGFDEILELKKEVNSDGTLVNSSRILIDFDNTYISESIQNGKIPSTAKFYLNLYDATSLEVEAEQKLWCYMISGSWKAGTGKLDHNPVTEDGASWKYRDTENSASSAWVTGSILTDGGSWFTGSNGQYNISASYDISFDKKDLRFDVTDLVNNQIHSSSVYPNNGFIVKREASGSHPSTFNFSGDVNSDEGGPKRLGYLKYFSRETHTIYPPKLEVVWDDSKWQTGSLTPLTGSSLEDSLIYMRGIRSKYNEKSVSRFRVYGRQRYVQRAFNTTPEELTVNYLPSASTFYSVRDADTEEVIVPFGTGSKVGCDSTGNYFDFNMNGLQAERFYRFVFKVVSGSGTTNELTNYYEDEDWSFRVVRNVGG
jgi:hypothetical protein|tara:strand:+ start:6189 stop:7361 length:1173 start_codon:yes stop_codon:yes gene_type:complete